MMLSTYIAVRFVGARLGSSVYKMDSGQRYVFGQNPAHLGSLVDPDHLPELRRRWPHQFLEVPVVLILKPMPLEAPIQQTTGLLSVPQKGLLLQAGYVTIGEVLSAGAEAVASILGVGTAEAEAIDTAIRERMGLPAYYDVAPAPEETPQKEVPPTQAEAAPEEPLEVAPKVKREKQAKSP